MIPNTVIRNLRDDNPMLWDYVRDGFISHNLRNSNLAYWDGAVLRFPYTRYMYETKIHSSYGACGMVHPSILGWLREFRRTGTKP